MGNLTIWAMFIITVNVLLIMVQIGAVNINPSFDQSNPLVKCNETIAGDRGTCGTGSYSYNGQGIEEDLPTSVTQTQESGNFVTDIYNTMRGWITNKVGAGYDYFSMVTGGVGSMLKQAGVDNSFANLINVIWWGVSFILVLAWIKGGDA
jgi:hypothetical protein